MTAQPIPTPRTDDDDVTYSISLGGVRVLYRLRWWDAIQGWYLRLTQTDGTVISEWHPVLPERAATYDVTAAGHPPGWIYCAGVGNGTQRDDLFTSMQLQYIPRTDL